MLHRWMSARPDLAAATDHQRLDVPWHLVAHLEPHHIVVLEPEHEILPHQERTVQGTLDPPLRCPLPLLVREREDVRRVADTVVIRADPPDSSQPRNGERAAPTLPRHDKDHVRAHVYLPVCKLLAARWLDELARVVDPHVNPRIEFRRPRVNSKTARLVSEVGRPATTETRSTLSLEPSFGSASPVRKPAR